MNTEYGVSVDCKYSVESVRQVKDHTEAYLSPTREYVRSTELTRYVLGSAGSSAYHQVPANWSFSVQGRCQDRCCDGDCY